MRRSAAFPGAVAWPTASLAAALAVSVLLACSPDGDHRADDARKATQAALVRGDRNEALAALERLRAAGGRTPAEKLELADLMVLAGEAPEAVWLLSAAVQEQPEDVALRLGLANSALLVSDAGQALTALQPLGPDSDRYPEILVTRARAELDLGDLEGALAILSEAERLFPKRPEARLVRIAMLLGEKRHDDAEAALAAARATLAAEPPVPDGGSPSDPDLATETGAAPPAPAAALDRLELQLHTSRARGGDREAAIAGLRSMVERNPSDILAWQALVGEMAKAGDSNDALALLEERRDASPEEPGFLLLLAGLQQEMRDFETAEETLQAYLELAESPAGYMRLAQLHLAMNDEAGMLETFERGLDAFPANAMLEQAALETLVTLGRVAESRERLAALRAKNPDDPIAEYLEARIELAEGDVPGAVRRLEGVMGRLDSGTTQFWLGQALEAAGDLAGAERRYGLAIARSSAEPAPYFALIRLARARGDSHAVLRAASRAVRVAPSMLDGWLALGAALTDLGVDDPSVLQVTGQTVARFPDEPRAYLLLARALRVAGRFEEALKTLAAAGERFEKPPEFAAERAMTLGLRGDVGAALEVISEALALHGDDAQLHATRAALLFSQGAEVEGALATDRALGLAPEDPAPLKIRCQFRAATGRLEAASQDCRRYLEVRPGDARAQFMLGAVEAGRGNVPVAIDAYRRAAQLDPRSFEARNNLSGLLAETGDLDGALEVAQEAYALAKENPYVLDTLGWLYLRKGLVERSVSLLEEAYAGAPEVADVQLHLARAYHEAGRSDDARPLVASLRSRADLSAAQHSQIEEVFHSLE